MSELVIPVIRRPAPNRRRPDHVRARRRALPAPPHARNRAPGSDWLYLKLYHPPAVADELIAGPMREFARAASLGGLADAWFFIRYADPEPHLRIRFHGDPDALLGPLLRMACQRAGRLMTEGSCLRFSFDVYEREVERYGGERGMAVAESIFAADSTVVADVLALGRERLPTLDAETVAILSADDLLASIGLSENERAAWYHENTTLSREDGRDYRQRQAPLRRLLGEPGALSSEPGGSDLERIFATRRRSLAVPLAELSALEERELLGEPRSVLCTSYVHLHCNRLISGDATIERRVLQLLRRTRDGLARAPVA